MNQKVAEEGGMSRSQLERIFNTLHDGIIACNRDGKILRINAAALDLFELASESPYKGTSYRRFMHTHQKGNGQMQAGSLAPWLMEIVLDGEASTWLEQELVAWQSRSGRRIYGNIRRSSVEDAQENDIAVVYVIRDITPRYRKMLHLQRVQNAVAALQDAIARVPDHIDFAFPEGPFLLSPPVIFVARQLVALVGQVLDCLHVSLLAFGHRAGHLHYAVGSGFTAEQEQYRRKTSGMYLLTDFLDETALASLAANQELVLHAERLLLPPGFRKDLNTKVLLVIPIFIEQELAGALVIARAGLADRYTPEEIELVRAVAAETVFVIECLRYWYEHAEAQARARARQEIQRLTNDFLNLASHELNTPLTVIKGNLQLAQRRLDNLKRQHQRAREKIERVQDPLISAARNAGLEERLVRELIDDASIQAGTLQLNQQRFDLAALLRKVVAQRQRTTSAHEIILDIVPPEKAVPVTADADRIKKVIDSYLASALSYSPADRPVVVRLTVEGPMVRVSVHDEGPGIPPEEQGRIWDRFYNTGGSASRDGFSPSLGLGLSLYLCQVFIERHHGHAGVQSDPGHGATLWFTLPLEGG